MAEAADSSPEKRRAGKERTVEDYKRKIWKLKKELEEQRELSQKVRLEELNNLRQSLLAERDEDIENMKSQTTADLHQMQEKFNEEQARIVASSEKKDQQIYSLKQQLTAHSDEVKAIKSAIENANHVTVTRLQKEVAQLKDINKELQDKYRQKSLDYKDKVAELKRHEEEAEVERQRLLSEALSTKLSKVKRDRDTELVRDRDLVNKVTELSTQVKRLEKRNNTLKEENTTLKMSDSTTRGLEEQIAKLKKRNTELTNKLKDKSRMPTSGDSKKTTSDDLTSSQNPDQLRKFYTRQRAKDAEEHAKVVGAKDSEIEQLNRRIVCLTSNVSNASRDAAVQRQPDLITVLQQSAKEKLLLESKSSGTASHGSESRAALFNLQIDYDTLQERYTELSREHGNLLTSLQDYKEKVTTTSQDLELTNSNTTALKLKYEQSEQKRAQLTASNQSLSQENRLLNDRVSSLTAQADTLKYDNSSLNDQISSLTKENHKLLSTVRELRTELINSEELRLDNRQMTEEVETLKEQVTEQQATIEQMREENSNNEVRMSDMEKMREDLETQLSEVKSSTFQSVNSQLESYLTQISQLETTNKILLSEKDELEIKVIEKVGVISELTRNLQAAESKVDELQQEISQEINQHTNEITSLKAIQQELDEAKQALGKANQKLEEQEDIIANKMVEIEELNGTVESQRDRIGELEQSIANLTVEFERLKLDDESKESDLLRLSETVNDREREIEEAKENASALETEVSELEQERTDLISMAVNLESEITRKEQEKVTLTAEISRLTNNLSTLEQSAKQTTELKSEYEATQAELKSLKPKLRELETVLADCSEELEEVKREKEREAVAAQAQIENLKQELTSSFQAQVMDLNVTLEKSQLSNDNLKSQLLKVEQELESCQRKQVVVYTGDNSYYLYVAKISYDPTLVSNDDNDNPNSSPAKADRSGTDSALSSTEKLLEISVNAGDYVFVVGGLCEEGYYEGRLLGGKMGWIPSNILEPVYDFDMTGFTVAGNREDDTEGDDVAEVEFSSFNSSAYNDSRLLPCIAQSVTAYPRSLVLDRQLANSILVGWQPPIDCDSVKSYEIYIDDQHKTSLAANVKCGALVEGVKAMQRHRVAITAVTSAGETDYRHCTIVIGEPHQPPSDLEVKVNGRNTAVISFLPHSSNHHHIVYVNKERVRNVSPGQFSVEITGLLPDVVYTVVVAACANLNTSIHSDVLSDTNSVPLSASTQFSIPSDLHSNTEGSGVLSPQSSLLNKFDQLYNRVISSSPVASEPHAFTEEVMGDVDFLKQYDKKLEASTKASRPTANGHAPDQMSCSTPKYRSTTTVPKNLSLAEHISPIITPVLNSKVTKSAQSNSSQPVQSNDSQSPSVQSNGVSKSVSSSSPAARGQSADSSPSDRVVRNPSFSVSQSPLTSNHPEEERITQQDSKEQSDSTFTGDNLGATESILEDSVKSPSVTSPTSNNSKLVTADDPASSLSERSREGEDRKSPRSTSASSSLQNKQKLQKMLKSLTSSASSNKKPRNSAGSTGSDRARTVSTGTSEVSPSRTRTTSADNQSDSSVRKITSKRRSRRADTDGRSSSESSDKRQLATGDRVKRLMIAVYSYDPARMSSNPDAEEAELAFQKGDILEVFGHKDSDGFYYGQFDGRQGYIPGNIVKRYHGHDSGEAIPSSKRASSAGVTSPSTVCTRSMRALCDSDSLNLPPISTTLLIFKKNDVITVEGEVDADGFYSGTMGNQRGLVSSNCLDHLEVL